MDHEVDEKIKKARATKLIELSNWQEKEYYKKFIGQKMPVLIETCNGNESIGHTSNYLKVTLKEVLEVNQIYIKDIK